MLASPESLRVAETLAWRAGVDDCLQELMTIFPLPFNSSQPVNDIIRAQGLHLAPLFSRRFDELGANGLLHCAARFKMEPESEQIAESFDWHAVGETLSDIAHKRDASIVQLFRAYTDFALGPCSGDPTDCTDTLHAIVWADVRRQFASARHSLDAAACAAPVLRAKWRPLCLSLRSRLDHTAVHGCWHGVGHGAAYASGLHVPTALALCSDGPRACVCGVIHSSFNQYAEEPFLSLIDGKMCRASAHIARLTPAERALCEGCASEFGLDLDDAPSAGADGPADPCRTGPHSCLYEVAVCASDPLVEWTPPRCSPLLAANPAKSALPVPLLACREDSYNEIQRAFITDDPSSEAEADE
mmetsp:Transcript_24876/g.83870  ORF Transcript_24876/g.83870 Transcript_24876/m.83870 type:complete len:358 (+) Transcript_24876:106-1179(+)